MMNEELTTKGTKTKAYQKYKPSGVEWLGDVPEHWEIKKFNYVIGFQEGPGIMAVDFFDEGVPLLRIRNIQGKTVDLDGCNFLDALKVANTWNHFKCQKNDLLISGSASTGLICEVNESGIGAIPYTGIIRLWPGNKSILKDYIRWLVSSDQFDTQISIYQAGSTIQHFGPEHLRKMKVTLPPLPEQQAIASFLDRETGRIDSLIGKKQRLLQLLAEQRTALISRAVTKGLDAKVKLKPSGVEWLGDVPEHWGVLALKFICDVRDGTHDTPEYVTPDDDSYPLVTSKDLSIGTLLFEQTNYISEVDYHSIIKRSKVDRGDILMPMIGTVGGAVLVKTDRKFAIKNIALFKYSRIFENRWLCYHLNSDIVINQFDLEKSGGVQGFVALGTLRNLIIILPPLLEQQAIAAFLDRETVKIDTLSAKVGTVIEQLKEYRTALISSAVTGKIDVREAV